MNRVSSLLFLVTLSAAYPVSALAGPRALDTEALAKLAAGGSTAKPPTKPAAPRALDKQGLAKLAAAVEPPVKPASNSALPAPSAANAVALRKAGDAYAVIEEVRAGRPRTIPKARPWYKRIDVDVKQPYRPVTEAAGCPTKVFKEKLGPVRNQASYGHCFGVVAADVLSLASGQRVSHFDLSMLFYRSAPEKLRRDRDDKSVGPDPSVNEFYGGMFEDALALGVSGKLCTDGEVSTQDFIVSNYSRSFPDLSSVDPRALPQVLISYIDRVVGLSLEDLDGEEKRTCQAYKAAQLLFPSLNSWQVITTLNESRSKEEAIHWMLNQACRRTTPPVPRGWSYTAYLKTKASSAGNGFLPAVNKAISAEQPVVVKMNAKRFHAGSAVDPKVTEAMHSVLLVGREFRDGECKYLVRNSFGPGCSAFAPPYNSAKNCDRGHLWISDKDFDETVIEVGVAK